MKTFEWAACKLEADLEAELLRKALMRQHK